MNDLIKRKKDLEAEFDEVMEMEDDAINTRSTMTIAAVARLINVLNDNVTDMAEIAHKAQYFDPKLTESLQSTVSQLSEAFSKIQAPTINVSPKLNFDIQPLQNIADKISGQNTTLINLISKFNNNQNDNLLKLITSVAEKQMAFLDREFNQIDIRNQLTEIKTAINNRPVEIISTVTKRSNDSRNTIEEIKSKIITNGR